MKAKLGLIISGILLLGSLSPADVGVFTGSGQNLHQISTQSVQLVSIDMTIVPGRGRFLFDGTVPGMDQVEYQGQFVLKNLTDQACQVQVGFPVDSQFARLPSHEAGSSQQWVLDYSFIARDEKTTYHVDFVQRERKGPDDHYAAIFTWAIGFKPSETKTLTVQYRIPMSMTLYSTGKQEMAKGWRGPARPWMAMLTHCMLEVAGYTTETGSSWAGNVEKASFTLLTEPFERYLDYRGQMETETPREQSMPDMPPQFNWTFPVQHVWWFRDIQPAGWQPVEGGIRWQYKDFKPKEPITARYYLIQLPRLPGEVDGWVDAVLRMAEDKQHVAEDLGILRQILLASYGQEPENAVAKDFVQDQIWYRPQKDFSLSKLTSQQQAVLKELDRRIEAAGKSK